MARTKATTQRMRDVASQLEEQKNNYAKTVQSLVTAGQELDKMWDGDSNDKFNQQLGADAEKFEQLNVVIGQYIENLRNAAEVYDQAEADSVATLTTHSKGRK